MSQNPIETYPKANQELATLLSSLSGELKTKGVTQRNLSPMTFSQLVLHTLQVNREPFQHPNLSVSITNVVTKILPGDSLSIDIKGTCRKQWVDKDKKPGMGSSHEFTTHAVGANTQGEWPNTYLSKVSTSAEPIPGFSLQQQVAGKIAGMGLHHIMEGGLQTILNENGVALDAFRFWKNEKNEITLRMRKKQTEINKPPSSHHNIPSKSIPRPEKRSAYQAVEKLKTPAATTIFDTLKNEKRATFTEPPIPRDQVPVQLKLLIEQFAPMLDIRPADMQISPVFDNGTYRVTAVIPKNNQSIYLHLIPDTETGFQIRERKFDGFGFMNAKGKAAELVASPDLLISELNKSLKKLGVSSMVTKLTLDRNGSIVVSGRQRDKIF